VTVDIIGLGNSAQNWKQHDLSIGVNDAWKFGKPTDALLVCNHPSKFSSDRLKIITESTPKTFYAHKSNWSQWFPQWKKINLVQFYGVLNPGMHYSSDSSPFIALSLAYNLGASKIILWGVDMVNHHLFNPGNPQTRREVSTYMQMIALLKEKGIEVFIGEKGGVFDELLPVYEDKLQSAMIE
jgi:hypothetical protein